MGLSSETPSIKQNQVDQEPPAEDDDYDVVMGVPPAGAELANEAENRPYLYA